MKKASRAPARSNQESGVAAVDRALSLLAAFSAEQPALTLAQMAERTGLYKSTILRLARSLEAAGYLCASGRSVFTLGPMPLRLAALYQENMHPAEVLMPVLRELARASGESAAFYVRVGDKRLCAYRVNSTRAVSHNVQQGELLPVAQGAGGRVLLAFSGEKGARFDELRARMLAVTLGERDPEAAAVACPVFGHDGRLEGAVTLSGPIQRFGASAVRRLSGQLFPAARRLTSMLGGDAAVYDRARATTKSTHPPFPWLAGGAKAAQAK